MTEVKFFVLRAADAASRLDYTCKYLQTCLKQGHRVLVRTASAEDGEALDELLWHFRPESFVPHATLPALRAGGLPCPPVLIGWDDDTGPHQDVLVNLAPGVPEYAASFRHVREIVVQQDDVLQATRQNWRQYRELGLAPEKIEL